MKLTDWLRELPGKVLAEAWLLTALPRGWAITLLVLSVGFAAVMRERAIWAISSESDPRLVDFYVRIFNQADGLLRIVTYIVPAVLISSLLLGERNKDKNKNEERPDQRLIGEQAFMWKPRIVTTDEVERARDERNGDWGSATQKL